MRESGFALRQTEILAGDCKHVSCYTCRLICVSVDKSDRSHKAVSPFHAITKVPRILDTSMVLMTGSNKCVNEAHHHDAIEEASQEHLDDLDDQVM